MGSDQVPVICRKIRTVHSYGIFNGQDPMDSSFPLFLLEVLTIIVISHALRFLLKPLRQPRVVTQTLGGIIIGPSVLSSIVKFRKQMFPPNAEYVVRNVGTIGFMYFLFISGVKMDVFSLRKVDRKHWHIALFGMIVPLICTTAVAAIERKALGVETGKPASILGITTSLAISGFPVIYHIIKEFNLISSEMGRMALSIAVISDVTGMVGVVVFEACKQFELKPIFAVWYLVSLSVIMGSIIGGVRQVMLWIVRSTPEGNPVEQMYVVMILLGVLVVGFITDMFGLAIANGPLWLGLVVPDGPPLGAILVEKTETIVRDILLPCAFMYIGMLTDIPSMSGQWLHLQPLCIVVLCGYVFKVVAVVLISLYLDMTVRDSTTLSLLLSLRGEIELLLFLHWMDFKMIDLQQFTLLVLISVVMTAVSSPVISILYDPTRPYMVNKRRNVQHTPPNVELHVVACVSDEDHLYSFMKLLDLSTTSSNNPFCVYALHHIELVGRANPVFIDHSLEDEETNQALSTSSLHKALMNFQESRRDFLKKMQSYTAVTPMRTMYQNICELALSKEASMIVLPLHKELFDKPDYGTRVTGGKKGSLSVCSNVLRHAPCSVAIMVDKTPYVSGAMNDSMRHFVVLFLGGADSREALSYADRAAGSEDVSLTVIRFLSEDNMGDDLIEKKMDDGLVTWFWVKNEGNSRSVYREVVVKDGEETLSAIQSLNREEYDLWIVGRKNGINPMLVKGLPDWKENSELGVIGDYIASSDFSSTASVLVVQQQILRGQDMRRSSWVRCTKWW